MAPPLHVVVYSAKVSSIISDGRWVAKDEKSSNSGSHESKPLQIWFPHVEVEDIVILLPSITGICSSKTAWEAIRIARPTVTGANYCVVSSPYSQGVLILWMACHGKLSTTDRLAA